MSNPVDQFCVCLKNLRKLQESGQSETSESHFFSEAKWSIEVSNIEGHLSFKVLCDTALSCRLQMTVEQFSLSQPYCGVTSDNKTVFSEQNNKSEGITYFASKKESPTPFHFSFINFTVKFYCKIVVTVTHIVMKRKRRQFDLTTKLSSFMFDETTADIFILTDDNQRIPAHKLVLMAASPVFKAMFTSKMSESMNNEINISDFSGDDVRIFLRHLYLDSSENGELTSFGLMALAHKYEVSDLIDECEENLCESITMNNAVDLLLLSEMYTLVHLQLRTIEYIVNSSEIVKDCAFYERITPALNVELYKYIMANKMNNNKK